MRAVANDQDASLLMGISVRKIFGLSWAISGVVAAIGGILFSSITYLHPSSSSVGIKVFPAVVLGGLDSIAGAIVGGLTIGIVGVIGIVYTTLGGMKAVVWTDFAQFIVLAVPTLVFPHQVDDVVVVYHNSGCVSGEVSCDAGGCNTIGAVLVRHRVV